MAQSATLSSSSGTAVIALNPVSKSTSVQLTMSVATATGAVQVDWSLDDPTIPGGPATTWSPLSSAQAMLSSAVGAAGGLSWTLLSPAGLVRINSSANNTTNTFTLKALQSISA